MSFTGYGGELLGTAVLELAVDQRGLEAGMLKARRTAEMRTAELNRAVGTRMQAMGSQMSTIGSRLTRAVTVPLVGIGAVAIKSAVDFQQSMEMIHTQAGASKQEVTNLSKAVLDFAKSGKSAQGPNDLAKALYRLEGAGLRGKKAMDALKASSDLAAVGNANVEDTAKTLAQTWFVQIKGSGSFKDTVAELNATVGAGDLRLQQLVDALGTGVLPAAKEAGLSLQDVTGALAVFGDETNNVSGFASQFATALHFLYNPSEKAKKAFASIGLSSTGLATDLHKPHGLLTAMRDLQSHLDSTFPKGRKLSVDEERAALDKFKTVLEGAGIKGDKLNTQLDKYKARLKEFGTGAIAQEQTLGDILPGGRGRVLLVLLNQLDRYSQKLDQIKHTHKNFTKDVADTEDTMAFKIHASWAKIQASAIQIGNKIGPPIVKLGASIASDIEKIANAFGALPPGLQQLILKGGLILALTGPAMRIVGALTSSLGRLSTAVVGKGALGSAARTTLAKEAMVVTNMEVATLIARSVVGLGPGGGLPGRGAGAAGAAERDAAEVETAAGGAGAAGGAARRYRGRGGIGAAERRARVPRTVEPAERPSRVVSYTSKGEPIINGAERGGASLAARARGLLGRGLGNVGRGGVAGLNTYLIAEGLGYLLPGKFGKTIQKSAGSTALGAAAGSALLGSRLGPWGAVLGGLGGFVLGQPGSKANVREKELNSLAKKSGTAGIQLKLLNQQIADYQKRLKAGGPGANSLEVILERQRKKAKELELELGVRFASATTQGFEKAHAVTKKNVDQMILAMGKLTPGARQNAANAMVGMASVLEREGQLPKGSVGRLTKSITTNFQGMKVDSTTAAEQMVANASTSFQSLAAVVYDAMGAIGSDVTSIQKALHLPSIQYALKHGNEKKISAASKSATIIARGGATGMRVPGEDGPDSVPIFTTKGAIRGIVAPGELLVANRWSEADEARDLDWLASATGIRLPSMAERVGAETRPHYARGGTIGRPIVTGPANVLRSTAQGAIDRVVSAARGKYGKDATAIGGGGGGGARGGLTSAGGRYNKAQLERLWVAAGGSRSVANIAAAIALAESGGNPSIVNGIGAAGLWQIYGLPFPGNPLDPMTNARMAVSKYNSAGGFSPWTTYTGADTGPGGGPGPKTYLRFMKRGGRLWMATTGHVPKTSKKSPKQKKKSLGHLSITGSTLAGDPQMHKSLGGLNRTLTTSIPALQERYQYTSQNYDLTPLTFLVTNDPVTGKPLDKPYIDQTAVHERVAQLQTLLGYQRRIKGLLIEADEIIEPIVKALEAEIKRIKKEIRDLQDRIRKNIDKMKTLTKQLTDEQRKKHPEKKVVNGLKDAIGTIKDENQRLSGNRDSVGGGGELGRLNKYLNDNANVLTQVRQSRTSVKGASGIGGLLGDTSYTMIQLAQQLNEISPGSLATQLLQATPDTSAAPTDTTNADLLSQNLTLMAQRYAVSQAQYKVLGNLPPYGGSFATGGTIPGPTGAARTIIAHGGEVIGQAGDGVHVHQHYANGMEWLEKLITTTVDKRTRGASRGAQRRLPGRGGGR